MVTIKIILLGKNNLFPCLKHIAAVITDVDTGRVFLLNHPFGSYDNLDARARNPDRAMRLYQNAAPNFCIATTTLYSHQRYDDFLFYFNLTYQPEFSWLSNNCATALKQTLDYFFPPTSYTSSYSYLEMLCMPAFLMVLALDYYEVDTPQKVYQKAVALERHHGRHILSLAQEQRMRQFESGKLDCQSNQTDEDDRSTAKLDEMVMTKLLRPLSMI